MEDMAFYVKAFITFFVLVNPLEGIPIFLDATQKISPALRRAIALRASVAVTIIMLVSLFLGKAMLNVFGISIGAFQVGGGIILFLIAVKMTLGSSDKSFVKGPGGEVGMDFAIVPLAIPLLAGPGAINGAVLYGTRTHSLVELGILSVIIGAVGLATYGSIRAAVPLVKYLKETGISIATRVMGLIISAIAVEMIGHGIGAMFSINVI
ncbi:MAG: NAAT family transporter [Candidatus Eremiobacteraeota bacterium]|nr:NAAT family transporter [Candidatus Eremiobacteraeota bacterium]